MSLRDEIQKLATENPKMRKHLVPILKKQGASEIKVSEVPKEKLQIAKDIGVRPIQAHEGIHGTILICQHNQMSNFRIDVPMFKKLMRHNDFRWIESGHTVKIGC